MPENYDLKTKKGQLLSRLQALNTEYDPWKTIYKDVRENIAPFSAWFPDTDSDNFNPLDRDNRYNAEVTRALRIFGAGMMYGNCRKSSQWFQTELDDPDLSDYRPVREWLDLIEEIYYKGFAQSNFYQSQQRGFEDQGAFGGTVILPEPRPFYPFVHFHRFTVGTYRLAQGNYDRIDTVYRPIKMQARNIIKAFGESNVSDTIKKAAENTPYAWFDVVHAIEPRGDAEYGKIDNRNMAFRSCWFERGGEDPDKLLRESGYPAFPCVCPRFIPIDGYPYGIGPGIDTLKRMKMLQQMELSGMKGLHREFEPPLVAPSRFDGVLNLTPNAVNWDSGESVKGAVYPIIQAQVNWQWFQNRLDRVEESVAKAFFEDLFLMILHSAENDDPQKTATEIMKRWEEKMTVLGPVTEHQATANFDPIFDLVWRIWSGIPGFLPPPPAEIQGRKFEIKYVSVLARAQRMAEIDDMNNFLTMAERVAAFDPYTPMAIDGYKILEHTDDAFSLPSNILRGEREYQQAVKARREQEARMQQLAAIEQASGAAKDLGQASTQEGTALGDLTK